MGQDRDDVLRLRAIPAPGPRTGTTPSTGTCCRTELGPERPQFFGVADAPSAPTLSPQTPPSAPPHRSLVVAPGGVCSKAATGSGRPWPRRGCGARGALHGPGSRGHPARVGRPRRARDRDAHDPADLSGGPLPVLPTEKLEDVVLFSHCAPPPLREKYSSRCLGRRDPTGIGPTHRDGDVCDPAGLSRCLSVVPTEEPRDVILFRHYASSPFRESVPAATFAILPG